MANSDSTSLSLPTQLSGVDILSKLVARVGDYINLMKPKIIVLLLISTVCPMVFAAAGAVDWIKIIAALVGGALVSGSASAMNCIWDRDIDAVMERTKDRPLAAGRVSVFEALVFSFAIGVAGLFILQKYLNPLAAAISLSGHLFYVFIYTIWLKRKTPQNIVIGGAAGAFPPLVGWAGVTGSLDITSFYLFMIIFLWTPPHFWALALNKNEDYKRAGVPMLPVVAGERETHLQMFAYALSLLPVTFLFLLSNSQLGLFSWTVLLSLGVTFLYKCWLLMEGRPEQRVKLAWDVFGFSLIYLAFFFVSLVVDSTVL
jgi:protoheme IX farnesyltransferase